MPSKPTAAYNLRAEEVCKQQGVDSSVGLSSSEVTVRFAEHGPNELAQEEGQSLLELIWEQFEDSLVRILVASAVVSFLLVFFDPEAEGGLSAYVEPLVIVAILVANAVVGVWQESNAEHALEALKKLQSDHAKTLRNGQWASLNASELVPGDIVEVHVGDKVPADMRVIKIKSTSLRVEESQFTGESKAVEKHIEPINGEGLSAQEQRNILFSSTTVSNGTAICVVIGTGMNTKIGDIQKDVQAANEEDQTTPLGRKIDEFGELLQKVIAAICIVVFVINYKNFSDPHHGTFLRGCIYYFKIAVALAVAAIPEGLPAVITTCLALGTRKMAQKNAIVRRLPSVETLGCTTVICSDKTGTLTTGKMNVTRFALLKSSGAALENFNVSGPWFGPDGKNCVSGCSLAQNDEHALWMLRACSLVNEAMIEEAPGSLPSCLGEPTEGALLGFVEKVAPHVLDASAVKKTARAGRSLSTHIDSLAAGISKIATLEFSRDRKSMSAIIRSAPTAANTLLVKGAPEGLIERSKYVMLADGQQVELTEKTRKVLLAEVEQMASQGLRTLATACIPAMTGPLANYDGEHSHAAHKLLSDPAKFADVESGLTFVGIVGLTDPPRPEVAASIAKCQKAGIRVIMITGDNKLTAQAIAQQIGIIAPNVDPKVCSVEGREWERMTETEQSALLANRDEASAVVVFSRTEPKHKLQIVKTLKTLGEITAMTGDGVNDAPALKMADIGIAMGITGTEVAKGSADMVLADDRFDSIVVAVEEGRSIYNNMKAFIRYLISSNIGEVASIFFTAALGIPEGLVPVQLLWVNLVTDGLPAAALGFNPPDVNVMSKPPRDATDSLISPWVFFRYMVVGIYVGFATVGIFVYWYIYGIDEVNDEHQLVSFSQLSNWSKCKDWTDFKVSPLVYGMDPNDPCDYFSAGKIKASTLSLTVLVMIEMLNAFNALSEDGSLLQMPPWSNPYLIVACFGSVAVHFVILYVPFLAEIFNVVPLTTADWLAVMAFASPVVAVDEVLKFCSRVYSTLYPPTLHLHANLAEFDTEEDAPLVKKDKKRD